MNINPILQTDYYKVHHNKMYHDGTTKIYSNVTPRKSRIPGVNEVVVFGIQYFVIEYLINQWNHNFFGVLKPGDRSKMSLDLQKAAKERAMSRYSRMMDNTLGKGVVTTTHLEQLWDLGYLPLKIKALPEGEQNCPL